MKTAHTLAEGLFGLHSALLRLGAAGCIAVAVMLSAGCAGTGKPAGEDPGPAAAPLSEENRSLAKGCLAAGEIHGQPLVTVRETIESVFTSAGLALSSSAEDSLTFERPATRRERGAYGTWFGEDARVRLRVEIQQQSGGVHFLRCRSYICREAGTTAEDEQSLARRHVRGYEGLLDEVSARLN